jgi:hypothetical protein
MNTFTPGESRRRWVSTAGADISRPPYISLEAHRAIASCMRYCTLNIVLRMPLWRPAARSIREMPNPCSIASRDIIVGANWHMSPVSTHRRPCKRGIQHEGSIACAASSTTTRSNGSRLRTNGSPAPVLVQRTTWTNNGSLSRSITQEQNRVETLTWDGNHVGCFSFGTTPCLTLFENPLEMNTVLSLLFWDTEIVTCYTISYTTEDRNTTHSSEEEH